VRAVQRGGNTNPLWQTGTGRYVQYGFSPTFATDDNQKGEGEEGTLSLCRFAALYDAGAGH
jgi:hypothetical protein